MSLRYLGNHEPPKWVFSVLLENDTALACYIFDIYRPILIIFCIQYGHIIKYSMQIIISRLAIFVKHQFVNKMNAGDASSATAGTTVDQPVTHTYCNNLSTLLTF